MMAISARKNTQNSLVLSSENQRPSSSATSFGERVVDIQQIQKVHHWKSAKNGIHYWTQASPETPAVSTSDSVPSPPGLTIHLFNLAVGGKIRGVFPPSLSGPSEPSPPREGPDRSPTASEMCSAESGMSPTEPGISPVEEQCRLQHQHVIALLERYDYLNTRENRNAKTIFTAALVIAALNFVAREPAEVAENNHTLITRCILHDMRCYGELSDEPITPDYRDHIFRMWIADLLFDGSVEEFIVQHLATHEQPHAVTTLALSEWLYQVTEIRLQEGFSASDGLPHRLVEIKQWIWDHVYSHTAPMLIYARYDAAIPALKDPRWGLIHAGLLFAASCGFDIKLLSKELALEAGKMLLDGQGANECIFDVRDYFLLPAHCHQVLTAPAKASLPTSGSAEGIALQKLALKNYFAAAAISQTRPSSLVNLQERLRSYRTRHQIAANIIRTRCPGVGMERLLDTSMGTVLNSLQAIYGDPTQEFFLQNTAITNVFFTFDHAMMQKAFGKLDQQEVAFLAAASIQFSQYKNDVDKFFPSPSLSLPPVLPVLRIVLLLTPFRLDNFLLNLLEEVNIFVASNDQEQRIYALETHRSGYDLKRIFTDHDRKLMAGSTITLASKKQILVDFVLEDVAPPRDAADHDLSGLIGQMSERRCKHIYRQLHIRGFDVAALETSNCVVQSFQPFYDSLDKHVKTHLPTLSNFLPHTALDTDRQRLPSIAANIATNIVSGRLRENDKFYSVVNLVGKQYKNKDIYVQINPQTGTLSGYKFTLGPHNILDRVPVEPPRSRTNAQRNAITLTRRVAQSYPVAASTSTQSSPATQHHSQEQTPAVLTTFARHPHHQPFATDSAVAIPPPPQLAPPDGRRRRALHTTQPTRATAENNPTRHRVQGALSVHALAWQQMCASATMQMLRHGNQRPFANIAKEPVPHEPALQTTTIAATSSLASTSSGHHKKMRFNDYEPDQLPLKKRRLVGGFDHPE